MLNDGCFSVTLETRGERRLLRASTKREARAPRVGFTIASPDRAAAHRIASYLTDVALELEFA